MRGTERRAAPDDAQDLGEYVVRIDAAGSLSRSIVQ